MVSTDLTPTFQSILTERQSALPHTASTSRSRSPFGGRSPNRKGKGKERDGAGAQDAEFLKEAYRIHNHLASLHNLLRTIRKPYLSTLPPPSRSRQPRPVGDDEGDGGDEGSLRRWEGSKYLTDRERDEIDLRAKIILRRCRERVGVLEDGERARQKVVNPPATSALYSFLPSLAPSDTTSLVEPLITAHRASVIWTLNDAMAKISGEMGDMQEERAKRREERGRTLGGQATTEAARLDALRGIKGSGSSSQAQGQGLDSIGKIGPADEPPIDEQLTHSQIQQFQLENNALLEHMESKLTSVLSAEKSLLEISQLQSELVRHLASQTEITDRLYDEAVGSVGDIGKANQQLKKARERGEEGRLFLLIFLIGASMALLFLDWYS